MAAGGGGVIEAVLLVSAVVPVSVVVCLRPVFVRELGRSCVSRLERFH